MTLVIAGIDTSSHVAGMCIYNIANNIEVKVINIYIRINCKKKYKIYNYKMNKILKNYLKINS